MLSKPSTLLLPLIRLSLPSLPRLFFVYLFLFKFFCLFVHLFTHASSDSVCVHLLSQTWASAALLSISITSFLLEFSRHGQLFPLFLFFITQRPSLPPLLFSPLLIERFPSHPLNIYSMSLHSQPPPQPPPSIYHSPPSGPLQYSSPAPSPSIHYLLRVISAAVGRRSEWLPTASKL